MKKLNGLTVKLFSIGIIISLLLIGNMMISSKLDDRKETRDDACSAISKSAGGGFMISGFSIVVPYEYDEFYYDDNTKKTRRIYDTLCFKPKKMNIDADISAEKRTVGIYTMPVFTGKVSVKADFDLEELKDKREKIYHPEKSYIILNIGDTSLQSHPDFIVNNKVFETYLTATGIASEFRYSAGNFHFETDLMIRGADVFRTYICAQDTTLNVKCDWNAPGFTGFDFLPVVRNITDEGFTATWSIPFASSENKHAIGFWLVDSVDVYKKLDRAINYGFLFIIVPFITLLLFELFAGVQLHPIQYLLSGAASVVFFLLLLAFSEHMNFEFAYLIASIASGVLVSLYVASISRKARFGLSMTGVFIALYLYLFCSLSSEDYALLIGSVFAFMIIGILMFFTRKDNLGKMKKNKLLEEKDIESSPC